MQSIRTQKFTVVQLKRESMTRHLNESLLLCQISDIVFLPEMKVQGTSSSAGDLFGGMSVHGGARRGTTGSTAPGHNLRPGSAHSSPGQSPANAGSEGRGHAAPESRSYNPSPSSGIHSGTDFTGVGQGYVENKVASAGSGDLFGGMSVKAAPPSSSGGSLFR